MSAAAMIHGRILLGFLFSGLNIDWIVYIPISTSIMDQRLYFEDPEVSDKESVAKKYEKASYIEKKHR